MLRPLHIALAILPACTGTEGEREVTPAPPTVTVSDPGGPVRLTAVVTADRCTVAGEVDLAVTRTDAGAAGTSGSETIQIAAGRVPDSREITGSALAPIRVHRSDGPPVRIDLLDETGVPLARLHIDSAEARVSDASRAILMLLARDGDAIAARDAAGGQFATVTGADFEVATLLVAPELPPAARALLACERLLANSVVPR